MKPILFYLIKNIVWNCIGYLSFLREFYSSRMIRHRGKRLIKAVIRLISPVSTRESWILDVAKCKTFVTFSHLSNFLIPWAQDTWRNYPVRIQLMILKFRLIIFCGLNHHLLSLGFHIYEKLFRNRCGPFFRRTNNDVLIVDSFTTDGGKLVFISVK